MSSPRPASEQRRELPAMMHYSVHSPKTGAARGSKVTWMNPLETGGCRLVQHGSIMARRLRPSTNLERVAQPHQLQAHPFAGRHANCSVLSAPIALSRLVR